MDILPPRRAQKVLGAAFVLRWGNTAGHGGGHSRPDSGPKCADIAIDGGGNDTELHGSIQIMIIIINNWIYQRLNYQTEVLDERFRG